jgi:hypothetical protein
VLVTGKCATMPALPSAHHGLDAFADMKHVAGLIELHGGAMHDAKHAAADLCAFGGERHAVNCRHCVVVDAAKDGDQRRHPDGGAGVLVAPRAVRVVAQDFAGDVVVERQRARSQISLRQRAAWVSRLVPHGTGALDPDVIVLRERAALDLGLDGGALEALEP